MTASDRQLPKTLRLLSYLVAGFKLAVPLTILSYWIFLWVANGGAQGVNEPLSRVVVGTLYLAVLLALVLSPVIGQIRATRSDNIVRLRNYALLVLLIDTAALLSGIGESDSRLAVVIVVNFAIQMTVAFWSAGITAAPRTHRGP